MQYDSSSQRPPAAAPAVQVPILQQQQHAQSMPQQQLYRPPQPVRPNMPPPRPVQPTMQGPMGARPTYSQQSGPRPAGKSCCASQHGPVCPAQACWHASITHLCMLQLFSLQEVQVMAILLWRMEPRPKPIVETKHVLPRE